MDGIQLTYHEIVNDLLLLQWSDGSEHALPIAQLRDNCPCASCAGEKDVFGNTYAGISQKTDKNIKITKYSLIGNYGVRFFFSDNHSDGIYTFDFLKKLDEKQN